MTGIEVRHLRASYGAVRALEAVNLCAEAGQITGLIGPNGAGKSTLAKTIVGLRRPDKGQIRIAGGVPRRRAHRHLAYIAQRPTTNLDYPVQVRELVRFGRLPHLGLLARPSATDRAAIDAAISRVGLDGLEHRQLGTLSGGQLQRANLARALAQAPDVYVLDEPFTGIDEPTTRTLSALLRDLADRGATILLVDHNLDRIGSMCEHLILLDTRVLAAGTTGQVLRLATDLYAASQQGSELGAP